MNQETRTTILIYKATIAVFKKWLFEGIISEQDYATIEQAIASNYKLSSRSIWRELS